MWPFKKSLGELLCPDPASEQDEWAKISYGNKRRMIACHGKALRAAVCVKEELGPFEGQKVTGAQVVMPNGQKCADYSRKYTFRFPNGEEFIKYGWSINVGDYAYEGDRSCSHHPKENFEYLFHNDFSIKNVDEHWNEDCVVVKQPATRLRSQEVRRLGMLYDHGKPNNFASLSD